MSFLYNWFAGKSQETTEVTTWNGAASYSTLDDPLIQFFFKTVRNITMEDYKSVEKNRTVPDALAKLLNEAWQVDNLYTMRLIFHLRDCRGGKGEKRLFRLCCLWLLQNHPEALELNMNQIPEFGSIKDFFNIFLGTVYENNMLERVADQLKKDLGNLKNNEGVSLAAKYAPTENHAFDKKFHTVSKLCKLLNVTKVQYRKEYLVPLRSKLNIVEHYLCNNEWDKVCYSNVPSIANVMYRNAFIKHDGERYRQHCKDVTNDEAKINTGVLSSYQIVEQYMTLHHTGFGIKIKEYDETIEAQWNSFITRVKENWSGVNILPIVDLSGSMFSNKVAHIAIALGLVASNLNSSPEYNGKWITFSHAPVIETLNGNTLHSQLESMSKSHIGLSTSLSSTFELLLNNAKSQSLAKEQMPQVLLILSDMQFNSIDNSASSTNWDHINSLYANEGYTRPTIIFWNLHGSTIDFPVPSANIKNCILLSGFNDSLFNAISNGECPNPRKIVDEIINSERYSKIKV